MNKVKSHRDLIVWQKAMKLVTKVYEITSTYPTTEKYGLVSQMRKAAVSIPSNIAEGYGRFGKKEYSRFLSIALGSSNELETQLEICRRLKFVQDDDDFRQVNQLLQEVMRMLNTLVFKLKNDISTIA